MKAIDIAKYIINKKAKEGKPINNLELQNYLFLIQLQGYRKFNLLIIEDDFEAWTFGSCVPDVYYMFCGFGAFPIMLEFNIHLKEYSNFIDSIINKDIKPYTSQKFKEWKSSYEEGKRNIISFT